jgi:DNA-directed RNA polymerase specialized sigma24 family protein
MSAANDLPQLLPDLLPRLWAFSLRLCGNQHDAEDLLQHTNELDVFHHSLYMDQ